MIVYKFKAMILRAKTISQIDDVTDDVTDDITDHNHIISDKDFLNIPKLK